MSKQTKNSPALATVMAAVRVRRRSLGTKGKKEERPATSPTGTLNKSSF